MKKCSVIVPMYKGKKYIGECIKSIVSQTYREWELILMDDGSPDDTYDFVKKIVDEYPSFDIRLLRQENKGVAETRNYCASIAEGEYVAFIDQDDTIEPDYLKNLMAAASNDNADIALCGYRRQRDDGKILKTVYLDNDSFSKYRIVAPWARVYKKSFLLDNDLRFLNTSCGEDTYLTIQAYALTTQISIIPKYDGYVWRYNTSSVSNTKQKSVKIAEDACSTFEKIMRTLPQERVSAYADEEYFFIRACLFYLLFSSHAQTSAEVEEAYNRYFSFLEEFFPNYKKNKYISPFRPKTESASVRLTVWGFMLLKKLGLAKVFAKAWSKLSK